MTYRVLLVGLGNIGMGYDMGSNENMVLTHARAFSQHPDFELVAGVDNDPEKREAFESVYSCEARSDIAQAMESGMPDIVVVATSTSTHLKVVRQVLEKGPVKAVLCEKPLAYKLAESKEMIELCARHKCKIFVNYIRRSLPASIEIRKRIAEGEIATPVKGVAWYSKGLFHNGSHFLDLLHDWLGQYQDFVITGESETELENDMEPDVKIEFEKGSVYFLAAEEKHYSHYTVELVSPSGRLNLDQAGSRVNWQKTIADEMYPGYRSLDSKGEELVSGFERSQWHVCEQLSRALRGEQAAICTGNEALETQQFLSRIAGM